MFESTKVKNEEEKYMFRCLQLAKKAAGFTAPNPMVGAVLIYNDTIIGEGYHQQYGGPHAEVNCINHVKQEDKRLISSATMYVSLEPCAHYGKTPPCADLIIKHQIPKVVIGCRDPFAEVAGRGIEKLKKAGVNVITDVLESECRWLNRRFFTFHEKKRPYVILKWAQSKNGFIAAEGGKRLKISNAYSDRLVHKWRSEEAAIIIGTNTARIDNPRLTNRKWTGLQPLRIVIDNNLSLSKALSFFDGAIKTIIFNSRKNELDGNTEYIKLDFTIDIIKPLLTELYKRNILSLIVEGGANFLQQFIQWRLWDEARIITAEKRIPNGLAAPAIGDIELKESYELAQDEIMICTASKR